MIENYEIISKIGEGGMGVVYLATKVGGRKRVAIKVLNPELSSKESIRKRFINEGITLSILDHPNIVKLYEFVDQGDKLFLVMEYIEGSPLDILLKVNKRPFSEEEFIPIFIKVLKAFQYAHENKIVHRDIKPSNIMLMKNNEPKILDFGIAKILDTDVKITSTGTRLGTVFNMSPEQVLGKEVDFRSDIYSLGITLYEVLTNEFPYGNPTNSEYDIMQKIVNEDVIPVTTRNPNISRKVDYIIRKATAKAPEERFQSCEEFIEAFYDDNFVYIPSTKTRQVVQSNYSFDLTHEIFEVIYDTGKWVRLISIYHFVFAGIIYFVALAAFMFYSDSRSAVGPILSGFTYILFPTFFSLFPAFYL